MTNAFYVPRGYYEQRCQRCGHTRMEHRNGKGSGRCRPCGKKCNRFVEKAPKEKS